MASKSSKPISVLLMVVACMVMLTPSGQAQLRAEHIFTTSSGLSQQLSEGDVMQCWSSIKDIELIEGCIFEIFRSLSSGHISILGPACCKAITEINDNCWPMIFPFNPFFLTKLKTHCAHLEVPFGLAQLAPEAMLAPARMPPESPEMVSKCCFAVSIIEKRFPDIVRFFSGCRYGLSVSRDCCIAIDVIDQQCWPKIFAFNYPLMLKSYCAGLGGGAPGMLH
ncbi:hypothetical protein F0562_009370 [Nyssa sinensis]|uniref:Prolamin-like domain-containing protein n=1 Tax=Nyssa sinensis TaxID=561372 RepID=A0A5J5A0S0_9ASTE|nr:hypothetical protein F0562_009370 [Nyssa sinensis]